MALQVLDPRERTFDFGSEATFRDMETGEELSAQPYQIRRAYAEAMEEFIAAIRRGCRENRIDHAVIDTGTPFDVAIGSVLQKRMRVG